MLSDRHQFYETLQLSDSLPESTLAELGSIALPMYIRNHGDGLGGAVAGERIEDMTDSTNQHNEIPLPQLPYARGDDKPPPSDEVKGQGAKDKAAEQAKLAGKVVKDFKKGGGNGQKK